MENRYYVYFHRNQMTGDIFYIGKGTLDRAYFPYGRNKKWKEYASFGYIVEIVKDRLTDKQARELETGLIQEYSPCCNKVFKSIIKDIPLDYIKNNLIYDKDSPTLLTWIGGKRKGKIAGCYENVNYPVIEIKKRQYKISRIIWVLHHGQIPDGYVVDHIDGNPKNSNIENLRIVSHSKNTKNRSKSSRNKSGFTGVYLKHSERDGLQWVATWQDQNGKKKRIHFTVSKYGNETARNLAINCRIENIKRLNEEFNLGYSDRHIYG